MLAFLTRETGNRKAAADLAAEVFAAVWLSAKYGEQQASAAPWMLGIARNKLRMSLRRGRVEAKARRRLGYEAVALDDSDLGRIHEVADRGEGRLAELVDRLQDDERNAAGSAKARCSTTSTTPAFWTRLGPRAGPRRAAVCRHRR